MVTSRTATGLVADVIDISFVDGPGSRFVVFLQGCNFDCIACHNPQTIPCATGDHFATTVDDVMERLRRAAPFVRGITMSGGEATQQVEFVRGLFCAVKADAATRHLTCFIDSNGACPTRAWDELAPVLDGAMIDLKSLDSRAHETLTGQPNDSVLASIDHLQRLGLLYEVRLLIVPGHNDDDCLLRQTGMWLAGVDPKMRIKVIGLHLHGTRPHDPPLAAATRDDVDRAVALLDALSPFDIVAVA